MSRIKAFIKKYQEPILYIIFGGLTTLVNFVCFWAFNSLLGRERYLISNIIAWIFAVAFAYVTNKLLVFKSKRFDLNTALREIPEFLVARLLSLGIEEGGLWLLVDELGFDGFSFEFFKTQITGELIAKLILAVIVVILNYIFSKFIIFAKKQK